MIILSMTIGASDFHDLGAQGIYMPTYLKNSIRLNHIPLLTIPFEQFNGKDQPYQPINHSEANVMYISKRKGVSP
jgi:hypothetical protein